MGDYHPLLQRSFRFRPEGPSPSAGSTLQLHEILVHRPLLLLLLPIQYLPLFDILTIYHQDLFLAFEYLLVFYE